jgi:HEPN domain-containing protein
MSEWKLFLKEGKEYLKSAQGKEGKPSRLSNDIRYNLLAMSLEKSCMAILMLYGDLADNHTFSDLLFSLKRHITIPDELSREILALEQVQSICNLYEYHRELPSDEVVQRLQLVAAQIQRMAELTATSKHNAGEEPAIPL